MRRNKLFFMAHRGQVRHTSQNHYRGMGSERVNTR